MQQEMWFPLDNSTRTTGRFIDHAYEHKAKDGSKRTIHATILESKAMGSGDVSNQVVKEHNREHLIGRCPAGWAHYEKMKAMLAASPAAAEPTLADLGVRGTPIEDAALHCAWNNDRLRWFKEQGILTVEQVAELTDMACQNLGRGAVTWRKKAKEFLAGRPHQVAA